jgi:hypothetical protein
VGSQPASLPTIGSAAPGQAYTSGSDITGVDATNNKYVDIYELDGYGKVVAFQEITLTGSDIK